MKIFSDKIKFFIFKTKYKLKKLFTKQKDRPRVVYFYD